MRLSTRECAWPSNKAVHELELCHWGGPSAKGEGCAWLQLVNGDTNTLGSHDKDGVLQQANQLLVVGGEGAGLVQHIVIQA